MKIDRVVPIEEIRSGVSKPGAALKTSKGDSLSISKEALEKSENLRILDMVAAAPDVRAERVAEVKAKINDPAYFSDEVLLKTADSIIDMLFPRGL